jgi:basic membrane lipoprotein Med (substrate-binding protein (PBP1-ABC) superfamily)
LGIGVTWLRIVLELITSGKDVIVAVTAVTVIVEIASVQTAATAAVADAEIVRALSDQSTSLAASRTDVM